MVVDLGGKAAVMDWMVVAPEAVALWWQVLTRQKGCCHAAAGARRARLCSAAYRICRVVAAAIDVAIAVGIRITKRRCMLRVWRAEVVVIWTREPRPVKDG